MALTIVLNWKPSHCTEPVSRRQGVLPDCLGRTGGTDRRILVSPPAVDPSNKKADSADFSRLFKELSLLSSLQLLTVSFLIIALHAV